MSRKRGKRKCEVRIRWFRVTGIVLGFIALFLIAMWLIGKANRFMSVDSTDILPPITQSATEYFDTEAEAAENMARSDLYDTEGEVRDNMNYLDTEAEVEANMAEDDKPNPDMLLPTGPKPPPPPPAEPKIRGACLPIWPFSK